MTDKFATLLFRIQAWRRLIERDALDLGGALGVRAMLLPHQVANVRRVLTAPEVRHLLADEVGLGKTVQAVMILTALRLQDPELRALVVVPNELRAQWRDELWTRGHQVPAEDDHDARRVRLAWPEKLRGSELGEVVDPARYHMLIVDEFHDLRREIQERILSTAPQFRHLLLVSATPPFQDPERRQGLLRMLEPTRVALFEGVEGEPTEGLLAREAVAAQLLEEGADEDGWYAADLKPPPPGLAPASIVAQAHCIYRKVVRTRREDYRDYMPIRRHTAIQVEPTWAEVDRQRLLWRYLKHVPALTQEIDAELLAQRTRSATSLQQRVSWLQRFKHEREGLLAALAPLLDRKHGDSRYEALVDLLLRIWRDDPDARVLVAAGDNLTVDALTDQLPLALDVVGPEGAPRDLRVLKLRTPGQEVIGAESLHDPDDVIERNVRAFAAGDADLLIASRVGKLGLNLQYTRHIVLYSVPWDPQEVEQWIGRVDRIGNEAVQTEGEELLPVEVYTITQRGLVDERVLSVLEASSIFQRSISLDGARVQAVRKGIREAALSGHGGWRALVDQASDIARANQELGSPLLSSLPWSRERAQATFRAHVEAPPLQPAPLAAKGATALRAREQAVEAWLSAMDAAKEYRIKWWREHKARTLCYRFVETPGPKGKRPLTTSVLLREVFDGQRDGRERDQVPFETRRADLQQPPRRELRLWEDDAPRNLYFMHHGSPLHDDLVTGWASVQGSPPPLRVLLPPTHEALADLNGATLALLVSTMDPSPGEDAFNAAAVSALSELPGAAAAAAGDVDLIEAFRADERLLRALLPAQLLLGAVRWTRSGWIRVPAEQLHKLLDPSALRYGAVQPRASDGKPRAEVKDTLPDALRALEAELRLEGLQAWSPKLPGLAGELDTRQHLVEVDASEREWVTERRLDLARAALAAAEAELAPFEDEGVELSKEQRRERGQLRRNRSAAEAARDDAWAAWARARAGGQARQQWLEAARSHAREANVRVHFAALLEIGELYVR